MFVVIRRPKMRRLTARRAYVRIDDARFIEFVDAFLMHQRDAERIYPGTYYQLRAVFGVVCEHLGLPLAGANALSLGSFRPGGATWLYRSTDSPEIVRFRGRWASARMLEVYIQEVGAASLLPSLAAPARERVQQLASAASEALAAAAALLRTASLPTSGLGLGG